MRLSQLQTLNDSIYDSKDYSVHDSFVTACDNAGGISFLFTDKICCRGTTRNATHETEHKLDVHYIDHPQGITPSCDIDEHVDRLDTLIDDIAEFQAKDRGFNFTCASSPSEIDGLPPTPAPPSTSTMAPTLEGRNEPTSAPTTPPSLAYSLQTGFFTLGAVAGAIVIMTVDFI